MESLERFERKQEVGQAIVGSLADLIEEKVDEADPFSDLPSRALVSAAARVEQALRDSPCADECPICQEIKAVARTLREHASA